MLIVPGVMGVCSFSGKLNKYENSVRGSMFCSELSKRLRLHHFDIDKKGTAKALKKQHPKLDGQLQHYAAIGDIASIRREIFIGVDLDQADYDGRTALHLAASEGHFDVLRLLIASRLKNLNPVDRHGHTPLDDAKRGNHTQIIDYLKSKGGLSGSEINRKQKCINLLLNKEYIMNC